MSRKSPYKTPLCWILLVGSPLLAEGILRVMHSPGSHTHAQRQSEVYGWFAVAALLVVLAARPLRLLQQRRMLGFAAFLYSVVHTWLAYQAVLDGDWESISFLSRDDQWAIWAGGVALVGFLPLALTSHARAMRVLGKHWKTLHRLNVPMTVLALVHTLWIGVHFGLESLKWTSVLLILLTGTVFYLRSRKVNVP